MIQSPRREGVAEVARSKGVADAAYAESRGEITCLITVVATHSEHSYALRRDDTTQSSSGSPPTTCKLG